VDEGSFGNSYIFTEREMGEEESLHSERGEFYFQLFLYLNIASIKTVFPVIWYMILNPYRGSTISLRFSSPLSFQSNGNRERFDIVNMILSITLFAYSGLSSEIYECISHISRFAVLEKMILYIIYRITFFNIFNDILKRDGISIFNIFPSNFYMFYLFKCVTI